MLAFVEMNLYVHSRFPDYLVSRESGRRLGGYRPASRAQAGLEVRFRSRRALLPQHLVRLLDLLAGYQLPSLFYFALAVGVVGVAGQLVKDECRVSWLD